MLRAGGSWSLVPEGPRVVWKAGRQSHSMPPDFAHVLPVLLRSANLPVPRPPFVSWSRKLARKPARSRARTEPIVEAQAPEPQYPLLLVMATIVGAGLQLVFGFGRSA
jgi:hypothetical protein